MKNIFTAITMLAFSLVTFAQTLQIQPNDPQYQNLKMQGLLSNAAPSNLPQRIVSATQNALSQRDSSTGICSACMVELDSTFSVVPFDFVAVAPEYRNDDGSARVGIPFNFCFYGTPYDTLFINNNGNLSFSSSYSAFTAFAFPDANYDMLAAFWGDVDTRGPLSGLVYYKITPTAMIVKWDNVGYFPNQDSLLSTFQIIITDGTDPLVPNGNVSFCYSDMQWTTGSASGGSGGFGGTPATVGANQGDGIRYFQVGRFDTTGTAFDGPYDAADGVDVLDSLYFTANVCDTINIPPMAFDFVCDTLDLPTLGGFFSSVALELELTALAPEIGQTVTIEAQGFPGFSIIENTPGNTVNFKYAINTAEMPIGVSTLSLLITDNGPGGKTTVINKTFVKSGSTVGTYNISDNNVQIFPNPANNQLNISNNFNGIVSIIALDGKNVGQFEVNGNNNTINLGGISTGVYTVKLSSNGTSVYKRLIKQ